MDYPIYNVIVSEYDDTQGPTFLSLVDKPASDVNFLAFDAKLKFDIQEEKRIVSGPIVLVDKPMYRDQEGLEQCYVVFNAENANKFLKKMARQKTHNNINTDHSKVTEGVSMLEFYQVDREKGKGVPTGFEDVKDGSIWASYLVDNEEVWANVKLGKFNGFSPEGSFGIEFKEDPMKIAAALLEEMKNFVPQLETLTLS